MEYCDLGSVRDLLLFFEENVPEEYISVISRSVLLGLISLHDQQKIHRDIKTENILVTSKGEFKLADFGIAGELQGSLLKRNTMIGTPFFLAPEVIVNEDGYGTKVDIWSFGISLLEMAEKQPPLATVDPMRVNTQEINLFSLVLRRCSLFPTTLHHNLNTHNNGLLSLTTFYPSV